MSTMVVVLQIIVFRFVYFEYKKDFWRLRNKNFIVYRISLSSSRPKFYACINNIAAFVTNIKSNSNVFQFLQSCKILLSFFKSSD